MKLIGLLPPVGILVALLGVSGCVGTPPANGATASARTPSWMRHNVVGSRIPREVDANGRPMSSDHVVITSEVGLKHLPSVTRRIPRGPWLN